MTTYSDEGCVVTARGTIINFSTRLARTNFYLIEWQRAGGSPYEVSGADHRQPGRLARVTLCRPKPG